MKIVLYTCIVSPHQLPLAYAIVRNHPEVDFTYIYTQSLPPDATKRGWEWQKDEPWMVDARKDAAGARKILEEADLVFSTERDLNLFAKRIQSGRKTLYMSERWFKPIRGISGALRLIHPRYLKLANGITKLLAASDKLVYLPVGQFAAKDMDLMLRLFGRKPAAPFRPWAYFVTRGSRLSHDVHSPLRVLWVGRMLNWKRVDTLIRAVAEVAKHGTSIACTIVGSGPEESRLKKLASTLQLQLQTTTSQIFTFSPGVPIERVRELMRENDVYVLTSDGGEGWGAALNEALEEGMIGIGTYEAGSSSVLLDETQKFHAGDYMRLAQLLRDAMGGRLKATGIGDWDAETAAKKLVGEFAS